MSLPLIILYIFLTLLPLILALIMVSILDDEPQLDVGAYTGIVSGCLITIIDLVMGITIAPEWMLTVAYTGAAFFLAFAIGMTGSIIQWQIQHKIRYGIPLED